MSADQPLTGDELATIKARATCTCHPADDDSGHCTRGAGPTTTLRLVAEIERLQAQVTEMRLSLAAEDDDDEPFEIGEPLARHPDGTLNTDPVCICTVPKIAAYMVCPCHGPGHTP